MAEKRGAAGMLMPPVYCKSKAAMMSASVSLAACDTDSHQTPASASTETPDSASTHSSGVYCTAVCSVIASDL